MDRENDFLVSFLDAIDERLLEYLDDDDELKLDVVQRMRFYASALLDGSITLNHLVEELAGLVPSGSRLRPRLRHRRAGGA